MAIRSNRNKSVSQDVFGEVVVHTNNFSIPPSPIQTKRKRLAVAKIVSQERGDKVNTMRRPSYYKATKQKTKLSLFNFENETKMKHNRHSFCGCQFCNVEEHGYKYNGDDTSDSQQRQRRSFTSSSEYTKAMILLKNGDLPKWLRRQIEFKIRKYGTSEQEGIP